MPFLSSQLHVNVPLTDYAVSFKPDLKGYLWSTILPPKIVSKRSNLIRQIDKGQMLRKYDLRVGKGGRVQDVQFKVNANLSYSAVDYAVESILSETEGMEADEILQYEQEQMDACLYSMHTNMEVVTIKETLRDTAIMTQNISLLAPAQWDNYLSLASDPVEDLKVACLKVFTKTTHMPNVIVMHALVWDRVQRHPRVLARGGVHPVGNAIVTVEQFEKILGVEPGTIRITAAQYNTALEDQTPDFRSMIGPDTIVAYVEAPSVRSYGLGCSFMFQRTSAGGAPMDALKDVEAPFLVYEFPDVGLKDARGATIHRLVGGMDQKVLVPEAGYLIRDCVDKTNTARYESFLNN